MKDLPPLAFRQMGRRIGSTPSDALELGWRDRVRTLIVGSDLRDGAGGEETKEEAHGIKIRSWQK
jgi:hypothetical protein